ncbi:ribonuclease III [Candidatus Comchoanobacter bicostacola]|uniref:Ribonuclease 3 n=1 Tax=Candidatus Comchoanobacter bicostacola TaxID=2919598 RepID=A0ABY5DL15_9GAMM|nr:ribonuclease III [Candidatus Comchoanobacter bicostacola]UTC24490.1 ribonuclease III [Candidatus Comchoanobacter bicostacola]
MNSNLFGYTFKNPKLLKLALTHRSQSSQNYERLEFLGDSVLSLCISAHIVHSTSLDEGQLSIIRSKIVSKFNLNKVANTLSLDHHIIAAPKQTISQNIRADVLEAFIGALYLDQGLTACSEFIFKHFITESFDYNIKKDSKTRIQEWAHKNKKKLPKYSVIEQTGQSHNVIYTIRCETCCGLQATGSGRSKQIAEQQAASSLYEKIMEHNYETYS